MRKFFKSTWRPQAAQGEKASRYTRAHKHTHAHNPGHIQGFCTSKVHPGRDSTRLFHKQHRVRPAPAPCNTSKLVRVSGWGRGKHDHDRESCVPQHGTHMGLGNTVEGAGQGGPTLPDSFPGNVHHRPTHTQEGDLPGPGLSINGVASVWGDGRVLTCVVATGTRFRSYRNP